MAKGKQNTTKGKPKTKVEISASNQRGRNKRTRLSKKTVIATICFVLACFIGFFLITIFGKQDFMTENFKREREIEFNNEYQEEYGKICHGNLFFCNDVEVKSEGEVDTKKLGDYTIKYKVKYYDEEIDLEQTVKVVDHTPPSIAIIDEPAVSCPNGRSIVANYKSIDNYDGDITEKAEKELKDDKVIIKSTDSHGNTSEKTISTIKEDKAAPIITINGEENEVIIAGGEYSDSGATATDNCNDVEIQKEGSVDADTPGDYVIIYKSKDEAGNKAEAKRTVTVINRAAVTPSYNGNQANKTIYLTFDDGPGEHTNRLLDILAKYNVKATFFVTGAGSDDILRREYNEGHAIGLHSYTHDYAYIYTSLANYFADLEQVQNRVRNATGYTSYLMRFPGGSSNLISARYDGGTHIMSRLANEVTARGFTYFDWNISSGDAGGTTNSTEVYNNVVNNLKEGSSVVLQHDIKGFSVDAVESIIKYGLANGYTFSKLNANSFAAHHGINN